jgi:NHLM bacteriocin system ABC transporter ATP-binding protein
MDQKKMREQIENDNQTMERSFHDMMSLLLGDKVTLATEELRRRSAHTSVEEICNYYHVPYQDNGDHLNDANVQIDRMLRPAGYTHRVVKLTGDWWKDTRCAMLAQSSDGKSVVALIPRPFDGYTFYDYALGKRLKVNGATSLRIGKDAIAFTRPLPQRKLDEKDVLSFLKSLTNWRDYLVFFLISLFVTLISLVTPWSVRYLLDCVVPLADYGLVSSLFFMLLGFALAGALSGIGKSLMRRRIELGVDSEFRCAVTSRIFSLPPAFFSSYASGELSVLIDTFCGIPTLVSDLILGSGITIVLSLVYLFQIGHYASSLFLPAIVLLLVETGISLVGIRMNERLQRQTIKLTSRLNAFVYNMYDGIQKIRNAGAEKRAFGIWASRYRDAKTPYYHMPFFLRYSRFFMMGLSFLGTVMFVYLASKEGLSVSDYVAFTMAYGMMSRAFNSLLEVVSTGAQVKSSMDAARPILEEVPELTSGKLFVEHLAGKIDVSNISFKYAGQTTKILDNISLSISSGEYVAFVGKTGCGKSTLVKLLLGFLRPTEGAVYYDGKDLGTLDLPSLRSHVGTVLQNGKLFSGDIISNITIMNSQISEDDVWNAAEIAGVADDIRKMPLGLYTPVSEGAGGLSGGQRQRIMIARALVNQPSMVVFDEAMSALDYLTQKHVSESLEKMPCTRIIVAHRLSTLKQCDQIFVLHEGKIVQSGKFDDLMAQEGGQFCKLFKRQTI